MSTVFLHIYNFIKRHRIASFSLLLLILSVSIFYISRIELVENIYKILPESKKINNMNFVLSNSKFMDKMILNISLDDSHNSYDDEILIRYSHEIIDSLEIHFIPESIKSINAGLDESKMTEMYDIVYDNLPIFLTEEDYLKIDSLIQTENVKNTLEGAYKTLVSPIGIGTKNFVKKDPLSLTFLALEKFKNFQLKQNFELYNNLVITKDHKNILIFIELSYPNRISHNQEFFKKFDELIESLKNDRYQKIHTEYFGSALVAAGNSNRIKKDVFRTVTAALVFLILFISIFFRRKRAFIVILMPVVFGGIVSVALISIFKSEISAISLGIGSIILGISVDYALHLFSHYRKNASVEKALKDLTAPILISSLTTVSAFLSLYFIPSKALNDLGLVAALSVFSAAVFSLVVLPHLLENKQGKTRVEYSNTILDKIARYDFSKNKILVLIILLISIVFIFSSRGVQFESDMTSSNYMSQELKATEKKLNKLSGVSEKTVYLVSTGANLEEALYRNENLLSEVDSLKNSGVIKNDTDISRILPSKEKQKSGILRWNNFWESKAGDLENRMIHEGRKTHFNANAFSEFYSLLKKEFHPVNFEEIPLFHDLFLDNFFIQTDTLAAVINILDVDKSRIHNVYDTFDNKSNIWIFDRQMITEELVSILSENFSKLIPFLFVIVFVILLISFGRIELSILAIIPIAASWLWTVGIMGVLSIKFNIFNIIVLIFILGLGIDYSIFIIKGLTGDYKYGKNNSDSYKVSVLLSVITTLLGIGVLIFARHPALRSVATVSIIGILSVLIVTFTFPPLIFRWMISYKKGIRKWPVTLFDLMASLTALFIFVSGAVFLTLLSFILRVLPLNKEKEKLFFHYILMYLARAILYHNPSLPNRIINPGKEDFNKPAVIIANHQSVIDLMLILQLHPRILILTNKKQWNKKLYGSFLRYADFIPADIELDSLVKSARSKVKEGYSIMVFPEGTRSETGRIKRFHKGAFYLANELGLELLPVVMHGIRQVLSKNEFFVRRGIFTTKILPRIDLAKAEFGDDIRQQAKGVLDYFRIEYDILRKSIETPAYFRKQLVKNYTYKGPVLEWYLRVKIKLENNYSFFNDLIPEKCTITDIGCGYGFLSYMLNLVSAKRQILAIDYDEDKIAVADNSALKNENISFIHDDISELNLSFSDVFILNDVLHYMPVDLQSEIINRCVLKLNKSGMIIIRDADTSLEKRHRGTRLSEIFSTGTGFNKTKYKLAFISRKWIEDIVSQHKLKLEVIDSSSLTSNLIYIIRN